MYDRRVSACNESLTDYHPSLPRLRELAFNADSAAEAVPLLEVHGGKLNVLSLLGLPADDWDSVTPALLDLCPHITELHLRAPGIVSSIAV